MKHTAAAHAGAFPPPVLGLLRQSRDLVDRLSYGLIVSLMVIMTAVIVAQVALRYLFNESIDWADETARLSFVWIVFLTVPHGIKHGVHVGLDVVGTMLRPRAAAICAIVNRFVLFVFLSVAGWQASELAIRNWGNEMSTTPLPQGLYFLALAIGCFHGVLHLASQRSSGCQSRWKADPP